MPREAEGGAATNSGYPDTVLTARFHRQASLSYAWTNSPNPSYPVQRAATTVPRSDKEAEHCHSRASEQTDPPCTLSCAWVCYRQGPAPPGVLCLSRPLSFALILGSSSLRGTRGGQFTEVLGNLILASPAVVRVSHPTSAGPGVGSMS